MKVLVETARSVQSEMPPRENPAVNISLESVYATGPLASVHCVLRGVCNYKQTGLLQAYAAHHLVVGAPRRLGFASGCQAFGHRELQYSRSSAWSRLRADRALHQTPLQPPAAVIGSLNGAGLASAVLH